MKNVQGLKKNTQDHTDNSSFLKFSTDTDLSFAGNMGFLNIAPQILIFKGLSTPSLVSVINYIGQFELYMANLYNTVNHLSKTCVGYCVSMQHRPVFLYLCFPNISLWN